MVYDVSKMLNEIDHERYRDILRIKSIKRTATDTLLLGAMSSCRVGKYFNKNIFQRHDTKRMRRGTSQMPQTELVHSSQ